MRRTWIIGVLLSITTSLPAFAGDTAAPILQAAYTGDTAYVQSLLDDGANVNTQDKDGYTALIMASSKGHTDTVKVLLDRGRK